MFSLFGRRGAIVSLSVVALVLTTLGPAVAARSMTSGDPAGSAVPQGALAASATAAEPRVAAERPASSSDDQLIECREMLALVEQAATALVVPGGPGGRPASPDVRGLVEAARKLAAAGTQSKTSASDASSPGRLSACRSELEVLASATEATLLAPASAASATVYSITGTVRGEGAGPLVGVWVTACPYSGPGTCGGAATAGDGSYVITGLPSGSYRVWFQDPQGAFARGFYSSSGFTQDPSAATPVPVMTGDATGIDVTMPPGYRVSGRVTAQAGGGLAGIQVTACPTTSGWCGSTSTTGDGTYAIGGLGENTYRVSFSDANGAYARGYYGSGGFTPDPSAAAALGLPPSRTGIDVTLPSAYRISGVVTALGGDGVEGISVQACPSAAGTCGSAMSTASGAYSVGGLLPGDYRVEFYDPQGRYVRGWYSASGFTQDSSKATLVPVVSKDVTGIDVVLVVGFGIGGTVTGSGGPALAGISVSACSTGAGGMCGSASTTGAGTYRVGGLSAGSYRVFFSDPTGSHAAGYYSDSGFTPDSSKATPVAIASSDVTGIDIELPAGLAIRGTVTGPGGAGLPGIQVSACPQLPGSCGGMATGGDGTYAIRGLAAGPYRVYFWDPTLTHLGGYYSTSGITQDPTKATLVPLTSVDATGIDVVLPPALRISGTVTGSGGAPLTGILVWTCPEEGGGSCASATTESSGVYVLKGLAAGSFWLRFSDPAGTYVPGFYSISGLTQDGAKVTPVVLTTGDATGIDVVLPKGARIVGMVAGPGGAGLPGITAKACPTNGFRPCPTVTTTASGAYAIGGLGIPSGGALVEGSYRVSYSDPHRVYVGGYYGASGLVARAADATLLAVPPDRSGIDVRLPMGARISGTVTSGDGAGLSGIDVQACPTTGGSCGWTRTTVGGGYAVTGLRDGSYRIRFTDWQGPYASGYYSTSGLTADDTIATSITVPADAAGIDAVLPLALHVTGTIRDSDGSPLPDVAARACPTTGGSCVEETVDQPSGTYTIGRLPPGSYRIQFTDWGDDHATGYFSHEGFTPDPSEATPVTLTTTDRGGVDVVLPTGYSIGGIVTGVRGHPASRISVTACAIAATWCLGSMTGDDGRYIIRGLAASTFVVSFQDSREQAAFASGYYSAGGFTPDPAAASPLTVGPNATGIDVKLPGARRISGTVTGPGGAPLEGIHVTACPMSGIEFCGSAITDAKGRYDAGGLVRGSYEVTLQDPTRTYADGFFNEDGFSTQSSTRIRVYVDDVSGIDMQTWRVDDPPVKYVVAASDPRPKSGAKVTISAQLADQGGHPIAVAGMTVTWKLAGAGSLSLATSSTDAKGVASVVFTMAGSPGQLRTITATDPAERTGSVTIARREVR